MTTDPLCHSLTLSVTHRPSLAKQSGKIADGDSVHPRRSTVGLHLLPRRGYVIRIQDRFEQVFSRVRAALSPPTQCFACRRICARRAGELELVVPVLLASLSPLRSSVLVHRPASLLQASSPRSLTTGFALRLIVVEISSSKRSCLSLMLFIGFFQLGI